MHNAHHSYEFQLFYYFSIFVLLIIIYYYYIDHAYINIKLLYKYIYNLLY